MVISRSSFNFKEVIISVVFWEKTVKEQRNRSAMIFFIFILELFYLVKKQSSNILIYLFRLKSGKNKKESAPRSTTNSIWELQTIQPKAFPAVSEME